MPTLESTTPITPELIAAHGITTEEYLRYEADVLQAQSETHRSLNDRWQVIAQQAVLYGNDLEGEIQ